MKRCSRCGGRFPDEPVYCPVDGAKLVPDARKVSPGRSLLLAAPAALIAAALLVLNGLPFLLHRAADNCSVTLEGFEVGGAAVSGDPVSRAAGVLNALLDMAVSPEDAVEAPAVLIVSFRNHNMISLDVRSLVFDISVNGERAGRGRLPRDRAVQLAPDARREVRLPLQLRAAGLVSGAAQAATGGEVRYQLHGTAVLSAFFGTVDYGLTVDSANMEVRLLDRD
jgi:hypothetical protein